MSKEVDSARNNDGNASQNISLNAAIKKVVNVTNSALAVFEQTADETSTAFVSRFTSLARQAKYIATRGMATYEHRGNYGPQIVGGTALVVGGAVALRRGRFPGALAGGLGGVAAYGNIYGYQEYYTAKSLKDYIAPKKNE